MRDVIVIGGGVSGLVAARECAHIGLSVTVLEATDAVGGAVAAHDVAGLTLDSGAESFAVRANAVAEFLSALGLSDEIVAPNPAGAWLHLPLAGSSDASFSVPLPQAGVLGIPSSPLAADVRRVIGWGGALRAYLDRLMPVLTIGRERSLGDLVRKRMGPRVLEQLVQPVAFGVYSASAVGLEVDTVAPGLNRALTTTGSLSGAVAALRAAAPAGSSVGGIRGGMSRLVAALVADLEHYGAEIVTGAPARAILASGTEDEPAWTVTLAQPATDAKPAADATSAAGADADSETGATTLQARFVIVATPGAQALALLSAVGPECAALSTLDWPEPTAVELATIVIDEPALDAHPRGTGVLVAADTPGVSAKALTHVSAKWEWVAEAAGPGRHVIRLSYGRAGEESLAAALSDEEFLALALRDASVILGVPLDSRAVRGFARTLWGDVLSPATLGASARVEQVREAVAAAPGVEVTGAWLAGTGLAAVIPDAVAAASRTRRSALGL